MDQPEHSRPSGAAAESGATSRMRRPSRLEAHLSDALRDTGYTLRRRIGAGGMGIVYLAEDATGVEVALKVLRPEIADDPRARDRLRREVRALQKVKSDNIARVLDAELDSDSAFVVTEYVPGPTLEDAVRTHGALHLEVVREIGVVLGETLASIHERGIVHRDLKPSNVMLRHARMQDLVEFDEEGERLDPVIIDFGIAQAAEDSRLTGTGLMMGTAAYLDPEVVRTNESGPASDWWAWAALVAFAASGREPYGGGRLDVVFMRAERGDIDVEGLPPALQQWLAEALHPRVEDRADPYDLINRLARMDFDADVPYVGISGLASAEALADGDASGHRDTPSADAGSEGSTQVFAEAEDVDGEATQVMPAVGDGFAGAPGVAGVAGAAGALGGAAASAEPTGAPPAPGSSRTVGEGADADRTEVFAAFDDVDATRPMPVHREEQATRVMHAIPASEPVRQPYGGDPYEPQQFAPQQFAPQDFSAQEFEPRHAHQRFDLPQHAPQHYEMQRYAPQPYAQMPGQQVAHQPMAQQQFTQPPAMPQPGMMPLLAPQYREAPRRGWLVFLGMLLFVGLGAIAPLMSLILLILVVTLARTWQRSWVGYTKARERGASGASARGGIVGMAGPRAARAFLETLLLALFPVVLTAGVLYGVDAAVVFATGSAPPLATYGAAFMAIVTLCMWWGIDGGTTRKGAHRLVDASAPSLPWTLVLGSLLIVLLIVVGSTISTLGGVIDYFPYVGYFRLEQIMPWRA